MTTLLLTPLLLLQHPALAQDDTKAVSEDRPSTDNTQYSGERWALVIGVNQYRDPNIVDLHFAVNDAKNLASQLQKTGGYEDDHIVLMYSGHEDTALRPTRANVWTQLKILTDAAKGSDQVLVYFSGHGLGSESEGARQNYLLPLDTRMEIPEQTALVLEDIVQQVDSIDARQRLIILDACRNERDRGAKSLAPTETLVDSHLSTSQGTRIVYSASFGSVSYEQPELAMGAFTWYWVQGLRCEADGALTGSRDGVVSVDELFRYTSDQLQINAPGGRTQVPTQGGESTGDFLLAQVPGDCTAARPPRPELLSYTPLRPIVGLGSLSLVSMGIAGVAYLQWDRTEDVRVAKASRMVNYGFSLSALGLGAAAVGLETKAVVKWAPQYAKWREQYPPTQVALQPLVMPVYDPEHGGAVVLGVQGRW